MERCVLCIMECLNKTELNMNWKCCVHQYILRFSIWWQRSVVDIRAPSVGLSLLLQ
jgi:hypothetical protein